MDSSNSLSSYLLPKQKIRPVFLLPLHYYHIPYPTSSLLGVPEVKEGCSNSIP